MHKKDVTPPGREAQVKKLKEQPSIDNPWAVAWASYNKSDEELLAYGEQPQGTDGTNDASAILDSTSSDGYNFQAEEKKKKDQSPDDLEEICAEMMDKGMSAPPDDDATAAQSASAASEFDVTPPAGPAPGAPSGEVKQGASSDPEMVQEPTKRGKRLGGRPFALPF